jgi:hypothetical protein
MKKLPEGQRTTLVFSSTPSGTVARATVREQRAADVLPEEIAEVEIDGERVFNEEDLATIATAAEQRVETGAEESAAEATEPAAVQAAPVPAPAPATSAPAPQRAVVRAPGPRRPMAEAEPGLPGATPATLTPVRRQSTVRVIGTPDARQATEPVPEAVAPPATAAAPAPRIPRATPAPPPLPTPSMATEVELAPEVPPARIRATPRRVTTAPSLEGRPLTSEQPARLSRLGRNGAGADVAQFSLNLSEQVIVSRPQGKVTMSDILDAAEQQEGETPQDR